jgi:hypothetical protein
MNVSIHGRKGKFGLISRPNVSDALGEKGGIVFVEAFGIAGSIGKLCCFSRGGGGNAFSNVKAGSEALSFSCRTPTLSAVRCVVFSHTIIILSQNGGYLLFQTVTVAQGRQNMVVFEESLALVLSVVVKKDVSEEEKIGYELAEPED